jgi:deoxyribonuclease V
MNKHFTWDGSPKGAIEIQKKMRAQVNTEPFGGEIKYLGGADISLNRFAKEIFAGIIVLKYPTLEVVEYATLQSETNFPYIPGLLSFREAPALIDVWEKLQIKPDILVVDGQGIAHPRRLGIATHIGMMLDIATVGCAKSLLYGTFEEPGLQAGDMSYLYDRYNREEVLGAVIRTKDNVKPVIVSPGYKVSVEQSIEIIKNTVRKYRLPEPTRLAHELVNTFRRGELYKK